LFCVSLWQLEIATNFICNDWGPYNVFFTWLEFDPWAVRDFWMICLWLAFIGAVFCSEDCIVF